MSCIVSRVEHLRTRTRHSLRTQHMQRAHHARRAQRARAKSTYMATNPLDFAFNHNSSISSSDSIFNVIFATP